LEEAEQACQATGSQVHLASVTSEEQQATINLLQHSATSPGVWIGLRDLDRDSNYVWSDDKPLEYEYWMAGAMKAVYEQGDDQDGDNAVASYDSVHGQWANLPVATLMPYVCAKRASPNVASGGEMNGCANGRWVMGTPYKQIDSLDLPPTTVYGIYNDKIYAKITPHKIALNETATTPAACAALVRRDHHAATAAEYSNFGGEWCNAVFEA